MSSEKRNNQENLSLLSPKIFFGLVELVDASLSNNIGSWWTDNTSRSISCRVLHGMMMSFDLERRDYF